MRSPPDNPGSPSFSAVAHGDSAPCHVDGERRHITVLFSDLSGFTAMSERQDPEDTRQIMSRILAGVSGIIREYGGQVDKFIGDEVMALFGAPISHEDDPVRAIKAALDIREFVRSASGDLADRVGCELSMHSGISTGLVVAGELDFEKGTERVLGDTVNLAARLRSLAGSGEVLVGEITYQLAERYFEFECLGPTQLKGKEEPVRPYRVLSATSCPPAVHRMVGLRSRLVGREQELDVLRDALGALREQRGGIVAICGEAGTGKSRLVAEFRSSSDCESTQWLEGRSYPYAQNTPYFAVTDLLGHAWHIEDGDSPAVVKEKVESELGSLLPDAVDVAPYVGTLFDLEYPQLANTDAQFRKVKTAQCIAETVAALARLRPTVVYFEDLHWADHSSVEVLRGLLGRSLPALFLCVYRPPFPLLGHRPIDHSPTVYQEMVLAELPPEGAREMLASLLGTEHLPDGLIQLIEEKAGGNPFYLEEIVNHLVERSLLVRSDGGWTLVRPLASSDVPETIQGVLAARIDHLSADEKRTVQESSVIGRRFLYRILEKITSLESKVQDCLDSLENHDLIRRRALEPETEYAFKHALTQDVAYEGLLRSQRALLHERIGWAIEQLFPDRLADFTEVLAYHYARGTSLDKAVGCLIKAGEKAYRRYSLDEANGFFEEAFHLLVEKRDMTEDDQVLLVSLLGRWAQVFYFTGDSVGLLDRFLPYRELAESLMDKGHSGFFLSALGWFMRERDDCRGAHEHLKRVLKMGEEVSDQAAIRWACQWLTLTAFDLGLFEEAVEYADRAIEIGVPAGYDPVWGIKAMGMKACVCFGRGDAGMARGLGEAMLAWSKEHSSIRGVALAETFGLATGSWADGDLDAAGAHFKKAIEVSVDPLYRLVPLYLLSFVCAAAGDFKRADAAAREVLDQSTAPGREYDRGWGLLAQAIVMMARGRMSAGLKQFTIRHRLIKEGGRQWEDALCEYILGQFYLQLVQPTAPPGPAMLAKNAGFLVRNLPIASRKAELHFNKSIALATRIGAKSLAGQAHLGLGHLHRIKGRKDAAAECFNQAIGLFEAGQARTFVTEAHRALESVY